MRFRIFGRSRHRALNTLHSVFVVFVVDIQIRQRPVRYWILRISSQHLFQLSHCLLAIIARVRVQIRNLGIRGRDIDLIKRKTGIVQHQRLHLLHAQGALEVVAQILLELVRGHAERLLNRLRNRSLFDLRQLQIIEQVGKFLFRHQVVHQQPRLRVENRAPLPLVIRIGTRLHEQQLFQTHPWHAAQRHPIRVRDISDLQPSVADLQRCEVFRETLVEPRRNRRKIGMDQRMRVLVQRGAPIVRRKIQCDEIAVRGRLEESRHIDRFALVQAARIAAVPRGCGIR